VAAAVLLFACLLAGCGMAGPPVPPTAKIPVAPTGLAAQQVGERVVLRWTVQRLTTDGARLPGWPRLEIHRAFLADTADLKEKFAAEARVAYVLPERVVESFLRNDIVVFPDVLGGEALREQAGRTVVYGVRAVNAKGQNVGFSNLVSVRLYPVPTPIETIDAQVTERAIELRWAAPERTTSDTPLEAVAGYEIYRSESADAPFVLRGTAPTTVYEDTDFRFGVTYSYRIRTIAQFGADTVESDNSVAVTVEARDVFPPPVPANLIAITGAGRVDLTWDASAAADLAGYNVYRRAESTPTYRRLTAAPLLAQSFADTGLVAGTKFFYAVTAVDAKGNESALSIEVAAQVLAPEQPQP